MGDILKIPRPPMDKNCPIDTWKRNILNKCKFWNKICR
jgi:hypothetical protein